MMKDMHLGNLVFHQHLVLASAFGQRYTYR